MKTNICRRMAFGNIKKNYRFFIPRILSEIGLLSCFYIVLTLAMDKRLAEVKGGDYLTILMPLGLVIIALLSVILMLYTNSFLIKQRKREFGLYSVLGMEKKHIIRVLFHESIICSIVAIFLGLIGGVLLYKISSLAICNILQTEIVIGFYFITPKTLIPAGLAFLLIDAITYLINCISIKIMKPSELLASTHIGEKEPKVKWVLLILGILALGGGYYISLTTENPLQALILFFVAIILVIIGTYFTFISGSIFILKALKRNKSYYYKPGHITAVSGLLYRMKQNAVGLASVAILATGVLIMISSTVCLYSRTEDVLNQNYKYDYYISANYFKDDTVHTIPDRVINDLITTTTNKYGLTINNQITEDYLEVSYSYQNGTLITDRSSIAVEDNLSSLCNITFITEENYKKLGGQPLSLAPNEVAICPYSSDNSFTNNEFILHGQNYKIVNQLTLFPINNRMASVNCYGMVVANDTVLNKIYSGQLNAYKENASNMQHYFCVKFDNRRKIFDVGSDFSLEINNRVKNYISNQGISGFSFYDDSVWQARENLYGMYGSLLFLGIILGIVCLFATVLIIYYKQISEGYEDKERFRIMQKIGMTGKEIKKTIRSQIMLVFFLPLLVSGIHVGFAYPILTKLMTILLLTDVWLFAKWCFAVYIVFALVYALIYKLTAKTYYKIVN